MNLSKEEFQDWKQSPSTMAFFEVVINRIEDCKDMLAESAGVDQGQDRFFAGMIRAFREVLDVNWSDS